LNIEPASAVSQRWHAWNGCNPGTFEPNQSSFLKVEVSSGFVVHLRITWEDRCYDLECSIGCKNRIADRRLARKRQQSKSEVIRDAIGVLAKQEEKGAEKKRPYDLVAHLIGCVDSGGANLSKNTGEQFTRLLREKAHARRSR